MEHLHLKGKNNFLTLSLGISFLLIAISILYALLIKPIIRSGNLNTCLNRINEERKVAKDMYQASVKKVSNSTTTYSASYDRFLAETSALSARQKSLLFTDEQTSVKETKDEEAKCYERYK